MSVADFYDNLSEDYDRFVNWSARLSFESPFFHALFAEHAVNRVLDVACGTGQHAIALAQAGYTVTATDISAAMVERARANAQAAGVSVRVLNLGFGELAGRLSDTFDAITCLGNSLPHVLKEDALRATLRDLAAALRPGGVLVIQNRNFDRVMHRKERFMAPETYRQGDREWIFFRFYDFLAEDALQFNMVRLQRDAEGAWRPRVDQTRLRPWRQRELEQALHEAGLPVWRAYGSYRGECFDSVESGDLILVARRAAT